MSMSVLNVLSKHLCGLPRLPLRLVLTVPDRASCAGVSVGSDQGGVLWIDVCMFIERGLDCVSLYNASLRMCFGQQGGAQYARHEGA